MSLWVEVMQYISLWLIVRGSKVSSQLQGGTIK